MNDNITLVWFRQDLRLADNPALKAAASGRVIPVYIHDPQAAGEWAMGGAAQWWLHHSLADLDRNLQALGSRLILRHGSAPAVLDDLIAEVGVSRVVWNRCYEPWAIARDRAVKGDLKARGLQVESFNASLLFEPWTIRSGAGGPFRVYTPFWRACRAAGGPSAPEAAPDRLEAPAVWPHSERLNDWHLLPTAPDWSGGLRTAWTPGEAAARDRLIAFLDRALGQYRDRRNEPGVPATSGLSPHLHWGEIGPRQVWSAVADRLETGAVAGREGQAETFLKEIVWREFSYHLLFHNPDLPHRPLNARFEDFPWTDDETGHLAAWQRGRTGYPIVDAGMRQLWATGWMHNRVRMVVASFLVKDLLLPWQAGEAWFWDTLVDADLASNSASWQWVAGCGADAAPYFRVFNPVLQGEKFDPAGAYVRHWVPEVARLPDRFVHRPWQAPGEVLEAAGVRLGETYPGPIVDHSEARARALAAFERIKQTDAA